MATVSEQPSKAAIAILDKGGNADDAAVAAAATLGATDPFSCGSGGGFMMIYPANGQRVISIDHRESAPAAFTPALFLENGKEIDFEQALASAASVGVPGTVRGWHDALERYGTMSFRQVLAPAIDVASKGFRVSANFNRLVDINVDKFKLFSTTSALYLKDGKALPAGTTLRNPGMAKAYHELAAKGYKACTRDRWRARSSMRWCARHWPPAPRYAAVA